MHSHDTYTYMIGILIDASPSMEASMGEMSRFGAAREAVLRTFFSLASQDPNIGVWLAKFSASFSRVIPAVPVGHRIEDIANTVERMRSGGWGTNFRAGLQGAASMFGLDIGADQSSGILDFFSRLFGGGNSSVFAGNRPVSPSGERILLFLSDGHNGGGDPMPIAEALKTAGIEIHTVGVANHRREVDEALLKKIASRDPSTGKPLYRFIKDAQVLVEHFTEVSNRLVVG